MPIDFPTSPANNDLYTYENITYKWRNDLGYWDTDLGPGLGFSNSASAPGSPVAGQRWVDDDTGILYTYYDSQWVEFNGGGATGSEINDLDEITTLDSANDFFKVYDGSTATEKKTRIGTTLGLMRGHIWSLTLSNGTDATNDIDIAPGEAVDGTTLMLLESTLTKRLDAAWAAGTGNGGLDTGSITDTTYHVYLIKNPTTGVVDALFSTSASSPTMPSGYTHKRRIGSIIRASSAIVAFTQNGDEFLLDAPAADVSVASGSTTGSLVSITVPSGVKFVAMVSGGTSSSGSQALLLSSPDQSNTAPTTTGPATAISSGGDFTGFYSLVRTNTNSQIRYRLATSGALRLTTQGWIDTRGRFN